MKKEYQSVELEVIFLAQEDVVRVSTDAEDDIFEQRK